MLISSRISEEEQQRLGLNRKLRVRKPLTRGAQRYMALHRARYSTTG